MIQLLLLILSIALLIITIGKIRSLPAKERKTLLIQIGIGIFVISLLLILMTGRIHWLGVIVGTLIPILKAFLVRPGQNQVPPGAGAQDNNNYNSASTVSVMTIKEAMEVLGLEGDIERGEINQDIVIDAHRKLIQKLHPDRGGNDYLAAKINQAKDVLLNAINH